MKKILLVCGTGVITCTLLKKMLEEILDSRGFKGRYEIGQLDAGSVEEKSGDYDLCVTTTVLNEKCLCPVIMAADFILGRNKEETINEICRILES